ncbi:AAA family ATPase [Ostreibacterium oceani]|uniref:AAA family ATPase n=1 Tax=Ostreibacterium oceani TaxID=2654998 RepID=A0A6N7ETT6_9GAMM|nr:AAA family ATPase [Ostreibacterium oceani]MPV85363.1 AAA family ATPase [Ostreibacterium oceani]
MYNEHFGFNEAPFSISPDPRFLYMSERHRDALAHLIYGAGENGGFVLLTGQVGTGKTTLIRSLLSQKLENTDIAMCLHSGLSVIDFVASVLDELGIDYVPNPSSLKPLVDALNRYLLSAHANGRQTVLIVDEAQNLSREILEQVRLLTNLETDSQKLLRIILVGQEELQALINRDDLRQLSQRITMRYHLTALNPSEVNEYVAHRIKVAKGNPSVFAASATRQIYKLTGGIPRLINVLCDRALLTAYNEGVYRVSSKHIQSAAEETLPLKTQTTPAKRRTGAGFGLGHAIALLLVAGGSYGAYRYSQEGDQFVDTITSRWPLSVLAIWQDTPSQALDTTDVSNAGDRTDAANGSDKPSAALTDAQTTLQKTALVADSQADSQVGPARAPQPEAQPDLSAIGISSVGLADSSTQEAPSNTDVAGNDSGNDSGDERSGEPKAVADIASDNASSDNVVSRETNLSEAPKNPTNNTPVNDAPTDNPPTDNPPTDIANADESPASRLAIEADEALKADRSETSSATATPDGTSEVATPTDVAVISTEPSTINIDDSAVNKSTNKATNKAAPTARVSATKTADENAQAQELSVSNPPTSNSSNAKPPIAPTWRTAKLGQTDGVVTLLRDWQLPTAIPANQTACQFAETHNMRCVNGRGGFPVLRQINRPALLELTDADNKQWLPVLALSKTHLTATIDGQPTEVGFNEIAPYVTGRFVVLLEAPNVSLQIPPGFEGEQVRWLRQRIAIAEGRDFRDINESLRYDNALVDKVKQFQDQRQLLVDGIVGNETLQYLFNVVADENTPLLSRTIRSATAIKATEVEQ